MKEEDRERLVRVEVGITTLLKSFDDHLNADCNKLGCLLHDDVENLKTTQKTARRITWSGVLVTIGILLRYIWKGAMNV